MIEGAYQWYWTKTSEIHTWQDFRDNLKKTFIKEESMTSRWKKMTERTQKNGETLESYYHEKGCGQKLYVGQGLAKAIGKLTTEIKIDEAVALTEILVVPDNFQEIPLLVGQPFTDQDHIVIIRRGNALRIFEDNEVDKTSLSNLTIPELPHPKVSLWAKDADIIPSNFVGFVVPDNFQEIPLLVGQPFTDQDHIVIIRRGNALRIFEDNEVDKTSLSNLTIPELPHPKVSLWAKDADIIPSFVGFVKVCTPCKIDADLYVEKRTEFDACIPRCIIKLNDVGETQIPILNLSNRDIAIKKGQRMIRADVCTEDGREIGVNTIECAHDSRDQFQNLNIGEILMMRIERN
ncbi:hypothetical protein QE152_g40517 [Popillia japonica]|uniref:Uncharacterized protein n=1 Tax=Popillia japonica TaxID=7064 RepID=A0AAW1HFZ4_POPJA